MNNRYLFKAKRTDNGEWMEGDLIHAPDGRIGIIAGDDLVTVLPDTLCQCTGLKDKNGKLIWENGILRYSYDYPDSPWLKAKGMTNDDIKYSIGAVFWQEWRGCWAVCGDGKSRMINQDIFVYCRNPNRTEVIGNIFDNPELLEVGENDKADII